MSRLAVLCVVASAVVALAERPPIEYRHGFSMFGALKYPPDYTHFDYHNPDAPKGGTLVMAHMSGFDTLAPLSSTGTRAPGSDLTLDRLLTISGDEMNAYYGDLAEGLAVSADRRSTE